MVNRLDYVIKKITVNKDNLEQTFAQYPTKRELRASQEKNLLGALKLDKSFPMMYVNRGSSISTKNVVLDGNHRLEALRQYFAAFPEESVEIALGVYNITDPELERVKFLELNNIVKPSSDDVIQQYSDDNEFLKKLNRIPLVSIYGKPKIKPLKVRVLMNAYIQAIKPKWKPTITSGQDIVSYMDNFTNSDMRIVKEFLQDYQETFGLLTKDSLYMKTTVFTVMMRIWYQNREVLDKPRMQQRLRKLMNSRELIEASQHGGNSACVEYARQIVEKLNSSRGTKFVIETEEEPELIV